MSVHEAERGAASVLALGIVGAVVALTVLTVPILSALSLIHI